MIKETTKKDKPRRTGKNSPWGIHKEAIRIFKEAIEQVNDEED